MKATALAMVALFGASQAALPACKQRQDQSQVKDDLPVATVDGNNPPAKQPDSMESTLGQEYPPLGDYEGGDNLAVADGTMQPPAAATALRPDEAPAAPTDSDGQDAQAFAKSICDTDGLAALANDASASDDDKARINDLMSFCGTGGGNTGSGTGTGTGTGTDGTAGINPASPTGTDGGAPTDGSNLGLTDQPTPTINYASPPNLASCEPTAVVMNGNQVDKTASCQFYASLEANQWCSSPAGRTAHQREYPLKYGYRYCGKFTDLYNGLQASGATCPADRAGRVYNGQNTLAWIARTMRCLHEALGAECRTVDPRSYHCSLIWRTGFDSHPRCYTDSIAAQAGASVCDICPNHVVSVFLTVDSRDLLSVDSLKQVMKTGARCGAHYVAILWQGFRAALHR